MGEYAVVRSGSSQYAVETGAVINVNRLPLAEGDELELGDVLYFKNNDGEAVVGAPAVSGVTVKGKVLAHFRGPKVIIFKQKRRKGFRRIRGHRQDLTKIEIISIDSTEQ